MTASPLTLSIPDDWETCLTAEHAALQSFVALLEEEQRTLLSDHPEALLDLADSKTRQVEHLTRLAEQRRKLRPTTLPSTGDRTLQLWADIRQMAGRAEQLNHTNGELIQIKLRHNQQALNVLHQASHSAGLYGPDGQQSLSLAARNLGRV